MFSLYCLFIGLSRGITAAHSHTIKRESQNIFNYDKAGAYETFSRLPILIYFQIEQRVSQNAFHKKVLLGLNSNKKNSIIAYRS